MATHLHRSSLKLKWNIQIFKWNIQIFKKMLKCRIYQCAEWWIVHILTAPRKHARGTAGSQGTAGLTVPQWKTRTCSLIWFSRHANGFEGKTAVIRSSLQRFLTFHDHNVHKLFLSANIKRRFSQSYWLICKKNKINCVIPRPNNNGVNVY